MSRTTLAGFVVGLCAGLGAPPAGVLAQDAPKADTPAPAPVPTPPVDPETLKPLQARRVGALEGLRAAEAELAKRKAEARRAEVDLFLKEHPTITDRAGVEAAFPSDPEFFHLVIQGDRELRKFRQTEPGNPDDAAARLAALELRLQALDAALKARVEALGLAGVTTAPAPAPARPEVAEAVSALVARLKHEPPPLLKTAEKLTLLMVDLDTGAVTTVAEEPLPSLIYCGSPEWSRDGKRILLDATPAPGNRFQETKLLAIEAAKEKDKGGVLVTELGPGNCPTGTPNGERVVFLLNPGAIDNAEAGVWVMHNDGTNREMLAEYGRPKLSPDGTQLLTVSFSVPPTLTLLDVATAEVRPVATAGLPVKSVPSWAAPGLIVTVLEADEGDSVALVDVTSPEALKVKQVLWRGDGPRLRVTYPAYSPATGRFAFVGWDREGMGLYAGKVGDPAPPRRLNIGGNDLTLSTATFSPDGRYLLFVGDRTRP